MIYLGTIGRMVGLKCPSSQVLETESRYTFRRSLEGKRLAQLKPVGRRTWSLQTSDATTPREHSLLTQFIAGAWGPGPFVFLPAEAQITNLMSPNWSLSDPGIPSVSSVISTGPAEVEPGLILARSYLNSDPAFVVLFPDKIPVIQGTPVTGSAYVLGSGMRVQLRFRDLSGGLVQSYSSPASVAVTTWQRLQVTQAPPAGSTYVEIVVNGDGRCSGPAVTWTSSLQPWSVGNGCYSAVVDEGSSNLVMATRDATYSNSSFTVTEVG